VDIIRRYLEYKGYNIKYVMNITDVEDKIIKKSIEENCCKTGY
jgi:cysteinyl-tRNA synthetase